MVEQIARILQQHVGDVTTIETSVAPSTTSRTQTLLDDQRLLPLESITLLTNTITSTTQLDSQEQKPYSCWPIAQTVWLHHQ